MKTLILRTFAHSNIWEGIEDRCHFEHDQKRQILEWEPNFLQFNINHFTNAIGIYIEKYFTGYYEPLTAVRKIANTGTENEQIISNLKIKSTTGNVFPFELRDQIYILIEIDKKLWNGANRELMLKIDNELVQAKEQELRNKGIAVRVSQFKPLAFSLESDVVNNILNSNIN